MNIKKLKNIWKNNRIKINKRLSEFKQLWQKGSNADLFAELVFCLFTPQSKAKSCWKAVTEIKDNRLLLCGKDCDIASRIGTIGVRFKNNKARYVIEARRFLKNGGIKGLLGQFNDIIETREWMVKNIKGMGYKEASHFLRNVGFGEEIAILDRHILKNLARLGVIKEVPGSLAKDKYLEIEKKMKLFSKKVKIPMSHLDLLFWFNETGEIFK
jgi:N-glycosylase/DNA lyase